MLKNILQVCIFFLATTCVFAQNTVKLDILHKLGLADFSLNTAVKNNLGQDFKASRLEYYISKIALVHDGGQVTEKPNLYVLVDATTPTSIDLGSLNIQNVEAVRFYIGVDSAMNHTDPAGYQMTHPLAPKSPSMHWGWAAGYRFLAFEGKCGSALNFDYELHGLGDRNYFKVEIPMQATAINGLISIVLDADYRRIMEDINLTSTVIEHGESGDAKRALLNMRDYVFSPQGAATDTKTAQAIEVFSVFPNPTVGHQATLRFAAKSNALDAPYVLVINDVAGRQVLRHVALGTGATIDLDLPQAGLYFVQVLKKGQVLVTQKLLVTDGQ